MGTLILVRHGQAGPGGLSAAGETQARKLAAFWIARGVCFDEVYAGTLERQVRTQELVASSFREAGLAWPEARSTPALNEYDAEGILTVLAPQLAARDDAFRELAAEMERAAEGTERNRRFQRMFEPLMRGWQDGALAAPDVESWRDFHERVSRALAQITNGGRPGRRVAAFTSGGPIGVALQRALDAPERTALELNWRIRNCSLTEVVFSKNRLSLDLFNAVPHLDAPALWTYR
jgi:broad specificity phosphatase PhoE